MTSLALSARIPESGDVSARLRTAIDTFETTLTGHRGEDTGVAHGGHIWAPCWLIASFAMASSGIIAESVHAQAAARLIASRCPGWVPLC